MAAYDVNFQGNVCNPFQLGQVRAGALNYHYNRGDSVAPVVALVSPVQGEITRESGLVVDVTDANTLRTALLVAKLTNGEWELIFDGTNFAPGYVSGSNRSDISGGFRFTVVRSGGWPTGSAVNLEVHAIDVGGNEAS